MSREIIKVKLDVIFKSLFSNKDNEDLLRDFLSGMLEIPKEKIGRIEILNPEQLPEFNEGKVVRLDLKMTVDDSIIDIEMQSSGELDYRERTLYYWAKMYSDDMKSGEKYGNARKAIAINLVDFEMFKDCKEYHSEFNAMEKNRHEILTDKFSIHFFELKKIAKNKIDPNNRMELWLHMINAETEEDLDMLERTNIPEMKKATMVVRRMSANEKLREIARQREKQILDERTLIINAENRGRAEGIAQGIAQGMAKGKAEGITEGIEKGIAQERTKLSAKLRKLGYSEEEINAMLSDED